MACNIVIVNNPAANHLIVYIFSYLFLFIYILFVFSFFFVSSLLSFVFVSTSLLFSCNNFLVTLSFTNLPVSPTYFCYILFVLFLFIFFMLHHEVIFPSSVLLNLCTPPILC